jgi:hypothetical protein
MTVRRAAGAQRVDVTWRAVMSSRNFRMLVAIAYGLLVVFVGIFADKAVTVAVTVIGALILGIGYALVGSRDRS